MRLITYPEGVGLVPVGRRQRPDPVVGQQLVPVHHALQDAPQPVGFDRGEQQCRAITLVWGQSDRPFELWVVFEHLLAQQHQLRGHLIFTVPGDAHRRHSYRCEHWDQCLHRHHPELVMAAVGVHDRIAVEAHIVVPQAHPVAARFQRSGQDREVQQQFLDVVEVAGVRATELQGDLTHLDHHLGHPSGAVGLHELPPGGQWMITIEHADVVHAEEATGVKVLTQRILGVEPTGQAREQTAVGRRQEVEVGFAATCGVEAIYLIRSPCQRRRIGVGEVPLVRRHLTVRMLVEAGQHVDDLLFCERRIHHRQCHRVKGQVPRGIPRVFPRIGHEQHILVDGVQPVGVAPLPAFRWWRRRRLVTFHPPGHVVVVELFAPQQTGDCLALDEFFVLAQRPALPGCVVLVRFAPAIVEDLLRFAECIG